MRRHGLVAAVSVGVMVLAATGAGAAIVGADDEVVRAKCTGAPKVRTLDDGRQRIHSVCTLPAPPTVTVTADPTPTEEPTDEPTEEPTNPDLADLPREPWSGGADYWTQFPVADAAGWSNPDRFPISVFFGKPSHTAQLLDVGVNTLMGAEHDGSTLDSITSQGMHVLAQGEWTQAEIGDNPLVVGHHIADECEMGYSGCLDSNNAEQRLAVEQGYNAARRARDDGRFLQSNYGNGVLETWWGRGTMARHVQGTDLSSVDKYTYTSPHLWGIVPDSPAWPDGVEVARAASYGWQQDQMEKFQDPDDIHPNWVFVETAKPYLTEAGARTITTDQIGGAVWSAIRHGALGIAYFQHNNNATYGTYSLVTGPQALKDAVRELNASVQGLAPVINSQTLVWDAGDGTDTMLKVHDGAGYLFAGVGLGDEPGQQTFTLPTDATQVTDVLTGRTIDVTAGEFTDTFPTESAARVYRFTL